MNVEAGTEVRRVAGFRQEAQFFVLEDDPPRRLSISSEGGPAQVRATFDLEPQGDGTRVNLTLDVELRGAARMARTFAKGAAKRELTTTLRKLKELAES